MQYGQVKICNLYSHENALFTPPSLFIRAAISGKSVVGATSSKCSTTSITSAATGYPAATAAT